MGKKSRKKKKQENQEKESNGSTGNVNGGSSNNNNVNGGSSSNNNNHNSIPTVDETVARMTTTTTMVLTTVQLNQIDEELGLKGYPKSKYFAIGYRHYTANQDDLAIASLKRGAENDSCVPCMYLYVNIQSQRGNLHLLIPFALECAIRGHMPSMNRLINQCYSMSKPVFACALADFWAKTMIESGNTEVTDEKRKECKKKELSVCFTCGKRESEGTNDVAIVKCGSCKCYSYCGKKCQTHHWKSGKHMNECRQVILLRKYCKPSYLKEIRKAIIDGEDPKEIRTLQRLRMKLGLNRPKEEYEELLLHLDDNNNNNNNNNINIIKPGTKVIVKGLVKASVHNRKCGIVTSSKVCISSNPGEEHSRVGVKLSDDNGGTVVVAIKIENLYINRPTTHEFLIGRKDGTVHIGSTPNAI